MNPKSSNAPVGALLLNGWRDLDGRDPRPRRLPMSTQTREGKPHFARIRADDA